MRCARRCQPFFFGSAGGSGDISESTLRGAIAAAPSAATVAAVGTRAFAHDACNPVGIVKRDGLQWRRRRVRLQEHRALARADAVEVRVNAHGPPRYTPRSLGSASSATISTMFGALVDGGPVGLARRCRRWRQAGRRAC